MTENILVIGNLGYHEETIALPIIGALNKNEAVVKRLGGQTAFFLKKNFSTQVGDWVDGLPSCSYISTFSRIFLLDWYYPALPLLQYIMWASQKEIPVVGLLHGYSELPADVASSIPGITHYEDYLLETLNRVIIPCKLPLYSTKFAICPYPVSLVEILKRPEIKPGKRIIFAQRWSEDKAPKLFLEFAEQHPEFEYIATAPPILSTMSKAKIKFIGWQDQETLRKLAWDGGYIWGAADQDLFSYSILHMFYYGLVPLLRVGWQYDALRFPGSLRWRTLDDAAEIVRNGYTMTKGQVEAFASTHRDNADNLALAIMEA